MTSGKPKSSLKSSYVVRFVQTETDQDLLLAIEQALEEETYKSFSDLCKQALRRLLFPSGTEPSLPMVAVLEQQVMTLQLQMMQLEQRSKESQTHTISALEQRIQQLSDRVTQLEQQPRSHAQLPEDAASPSEPDPLLSRLAPFLDDF
jgi:hypothetical protein